MNDHTVGCVHWRDELGILCGGLLGIGAHDRRIWRPGSHSMTVNCIDCRTIAALVEEGADDTEQTEILIRERVRYAAR